MVKMKNTVTYKIKKRKKISETWKELELDFFHKNEKIGDATLRECEDCVNLTFFSIKEKYKHRGLGTASIKKIKEYAERKNKNLAVHSGGDTYDFFKGAEVPIIYSDNIDN